jgi:hypothetical protein
LINALRTSVLLSSLLLLFGCQSASEIRRDELRGIKFWGNTLHTDTYPEDWPDLVGLGAQCRAIRGSFLSEATATSDDALKRMSLFDVLGLSEPTSDALAISIDISVQWTDESGDSAVSLLVKPAIETPDPTPSEIEVTAFRRGEFSNCFCLDQALFCPATETGGGALGTVAAIFYQKDLHFALAQDDSLVVRVQETRAGVALIIPYSSRSVTWIRYPSLDSAVSR